MKSDNPPLNLPGAVFYLPDYFAGIPPFMNAF
jgi:hypothetical protein